MHTALATWHRPPQHDSAEHAEPHHRAGRALRARTVGAQRPRPGLAVGGNLSVARGPRACQRADWTGPVGALSGSTGRKQRAPHARVTRTVHTRHDRGTSTVAPTLGLEPKAPRLSGELRSRLQW